MLTLTSLVKTLMVGPSGCEAESYWLRIERWKLLFRVYTVPITQHLVFTIIRFYITPTTYNGYITNLKSSHFHQKEERVFKNKFRCGCSPSGLLVQENNNCRKIQTSSWKLTTAPALGGLFKNLTFCFCLSPHQTCFSDAPKQLNVIVLLKGTMSKWEK